MIIKVGLKTLLAHYIRTTFPDKWAVISYPKDPGDIIWDDIEVEVYNTEEEAQQNFTHRYYPTPTEILPSDSIGVK